MRRDRAVRRACVVACIVASVLASGCRTKRKIKVLQTDEDDSPALSSIVHVADPRVSSQLVSGFYNIEENGWRWTAGKFAVLLRPPRGSTTKGATLTLKFSVPPAVIAKVKAFSLSAAVNGSPLPPETYTQAGPFTYTRDVNADLLSSDAVKVQFAMDKFLPPSDADSRELGVVVTVVGFEMK